MMKIIKATAEQRAAYANTGAVYPLHGYIEKDGKKLPVEDLRGHWSRPDPVYELMAPKGYHFGRADDSCASCLHSMLGHTLAGVIEDAEYATLSECKGE